MGLGNYPEEFYKLLRKTIVLSMSGNHGNLEVLRTLYNVNSSVHLPVLMEDSKIYELGKGRLGRMFQGRYQMNT